MGLVPTIVEKEVLCLFRWAGLGVRSGEVVQ